jgi:small subunit ribosomal protein S6
MKLTTATKTKVYELTYLAPGSLTDSELTKVQETVQGLVKKHKGSISSETSWGKKPLAYRIKRAGKTHTEAHYLHLVLEFPTEEAIAFEREIYLDNDLIRHLFVEAKTEEKPEVAVK